MPRELHSIIGKNPKNGFDVLQCSICDEFKVVLGNRRMGGIRWCRDCIKLSFGWVQFSEDQREALMNAFDRVESEPSAKKLVDVAAKVPSSLKQANSIGEARLRVLDADMRENRG